MTRKTVAFVHTGAVDTGQRLAFVDVHLAVGARQTRWAAAVEAGAVASTGGVVVAVDHIAEILRLVLAMVPVKSCRQIVIAVLLWSMDGAIREGGQTVIAVLLSGLGGAIREHGQTYSDRSSFVWSGWCGQEA